MQDKANDDTIRLAMAPHGKAVVQKNPLEINVDVDAAGRVSIARMPLSGELLTRILRKTVAEYGTDVPVVIRGDGQDEA